MKPITQQTSLEFSNLIGLPYSQANCWDLAILFYKQIFDTELKHYYQNKQKAEDNRDLTQSLIYTSKGDFVETKNPKFGDLITLKIRGIESHIAIYVGQGLILHTDKRNGSHIDRLAKFAKMICGFYRLKEVEQND